MFSSPYHLSVDDRLWHELTLINGIRNFESPGKTQRLCCCMGFFLQTNNMTLRTRPSKDPEPLISVFCEPFSQLGNIRDEFIATHHDHHAPYPLEKDTKSVM